MRARKRKKNTKMMERKKEDSDIDVLSSLPDCVLSHILSFMETRTAVRWSLASKRFRNLWTLSPVLDFRLLPDRNDRRVAFESFVNNVLQRREQSFRLTAFRLSLHMAMKPEFVENCLRYAALHKVEHLRLRAFTARNLRAVILPNSLITSSFLTNLRLSNAIWSSINLPNSFSLPNLNVLHLKKFDFSRSDCNGEVFSGCPNLETLILNKCRIKARRKLEICLLVNCLNLKNLEIKNWRSPWVHFDFHFIRVNAPKLHFFKLKGPAVNTKFTGGLPCMNNAWIDLFYPVACARVDLENRLGLSSECLTLLLRELCHVRSLSISFNTIEVLCAYVNLEEFALVFENLKFMTFTAEENYAQMIIPVSTTLRQSMKDPEIDYFPLADFKEQKYLKNCSEDGLGDEDVSAINFSTQVMNLLLESCPTVEFLTFEIPKAPPKAEVFEHETSMS